MAEVHQFRKSLDSKARVSKIVGDAVTYLREADEENAKKQEAANIVSGVLADLEWHMRRLWALEPDYAEQRVKFIMADIKLGAK